MQYRAATVGKARLVWVAPSGQGVVGPRSADQKLPAKHCLAVQLILWQYSGDPTLVVYSAL
jgi:hypothetical protein